MLQITLEHFQWLTKYLFLCLDVTVPVVEAFFSLHRLILQTSRVKSHAHLVNIACGALETLGFPQATKKNDHPIVYCLALKSHIWINNDVDNVENEDNPIALYIHRVHKRYHIHCIALEWSGFWTTSFNNSLERESDPNDFITCANFQNEISARIQSLILE